MEPTGAELRNPPIVQVRAPVLHPPPQTDTRERDGAKHRAASNDYRADGRGVARNLPQAPCLRTQWTRPQPLHPREHHRRGGQRCQSPEGDAVRAPLAPRAVTDRVPTRGVTDALALDGQRRRVLIETGGGTLPLQATRDERDADSVGDCPIDGPAQAHVPGREQERRDDRQCPAEGCGAAGGHRRLLRPSRGGVRGNSVYHGLRDAQSSVAPPVATALRPSGAKTGEMGVDGHRWVREGKGWWRGGEGERVCVCEDDEAEREEGEGT